jgi:hypothetical protein
MHLMKILTSKAVILKDTMKLLQTKFLMIKLIRRYFTIHKNCKKKKKKKNKKKKKTRQSEISQK